MRAAHVVASPGPDADPNGHTIVSVDEWGFQYDEGMVFLCPHCTRWIHESAGAADERPEACDSCWWWLRIIDVIKGVGSASLTS